MGTATELCFMVVRVALVLAAALPVAGCSDDKGSEESLPLCDGSGGARLFDPTRLAVIELEVGDEALAILRKEGKNESNPAEFQYVQAEMKYDGEVVGAVGLRVKGGSSRLDAHGDAFPFKVDTNRFVKGLELDGIRKFNLHITRSDFFLFEYLSYGAWRDFGVAAPRTGWARVSLNGAVLGVYTVVEQVNEDLLARYYDDCHGDLYKPEAPAGALIYQGDRIANYENVNSKGDAKTDHRTFLNFVRTINNSPVEEWSEVVDLESVLTYFAVNVALGNWDTYTRYGHNYYLFESSPGIMSMLPWDMNLSQGSSGTLCYVPEEPRPLYDRLLAVRDYELRYFQITGEFLAGAGSVEALHQRIDDAVLVLGEELPLSEEQVQTLKTNIDLRVRDLVQTLDTVAACPGFGRNSGDSGRDLELP